MTMRMSAKSFSVAASPHAACRYKLLAVSGSAWEHKVLGQDKHPSQEQSMLPANHAGCLHFDASAGACGRPHAAAAACITHTLAHGMQQTATGCC